ncbi:LapA family protein [Pseudoalteromonas luteoviolacea]|uniref:LapA family protein n=1 Tax=Pseudoalteromonas luteoviolacea TaxID=43657 RepID=UPI0007B07831|nr:LapA family protein [Pseudoalteromonas luteoviolacea]
MVRVLKKGLLLVLLLVAFVVGTQNPNVVEVNFIVASAEMPLATLLSLCLFSGILLGVLFNLASIVRLKQKNNQLHKTNNLLLNKDQSKP